ITSAVVGSENAMSISLNSSGQRSTGDLLLPLEELRRRQSTKWQRYRDDVIPAWVAEMDFSPAPPVQRTMDALVRGHEFGYPMRNKDRADIAVSHAFVRRMEKQFGWKIQADMVQPLADLVQATFACVMAYSEPGDGVVLQIPAYPPFRDAIVE